MNPFAGRLTVFAVVIIVVIVKKNRMKKRGQEQEFRSPLENIICDVVQSNSQNPIEQTNFHFNDASVTCLTDGLTDGHLYFSAIS
ncbi:MAG: hypothetical protein ACRC10_07205 [Thermoguttaceae bacterium]